MRPIFFLVLSIWIFFSACTENPNAILIQGRWQGASWIANGAPKAVSIDAVYFEFDTTGHYVFTYNDKPEKGTYKVEKELLFTKAEGQQEMMVKIELLTLDSLVLGMNNGGTAEKLTLIRQDEQPAKTSSENKSYLQLTDDGTYRLKPGQRAQIKVYENTSTGSYWQVLKPTDSTTIRIQNDDYIPESTDPYIVGAGGTRIFTIEGVKRGQDSLVLFHGREWEPESWSFNRYAIIVE
jgi:predicted secreted protein